MLRSLFYFLLMCPLLGYAQPTELNFYRPAINHNLVSIKGNCLQQSERVKREDAWRCVAEGKTYDPCLAKTAGIQSQVICPLSPWGSKGIEISVQQPLNYQDHQPLDMSRGFPWAVELVNGERCMAVDPGKMVEELPLRYQCDHGVVLLGTISRCTPTWKITRRSGNEISEGVISRVWF